MRQGTLIRFLDLLRRELGADDVRAEVGGKDPEDPRLVWTNLPTGWRLVAVFQEPPESCDEKLQRLVHLAQGFSYTLHELSAPAPPNTPAEGAFRRLDAALEALRSRVGSVGVAVIDVQSPVLWGSSDPEWRGEDVTSMVEIGQALRATLESGVELDAICAMQAEDVPARLRDLGVGTEHAGAIGRVLVQHDETALRHQLLTCLAVARSRAEALPSPPNRWAHHETQFGYFVRTFANIYLLVVVFEGAFSELYVESAVVHALPAIEQLIMALPPLDPGPVAKGGRVIRLRR